MPEVRVASALAANTLEVEHPIRFIDSKQPGDVTLAARDLVLQLAALQIVEIEVAPVVFLREPDRLITLGQVAPVDVIVAGFEEGLALFLEDLPNDARCGIRNAQVGLLMVARRGDE